MNIIIVSPLLSDSANLLLNCDLVRYGPLALETIFALSMSTFVLFVQTIVFTIMNLTIILETLNCNSDTYLRCVFKDLKYDRHSV